MTPHLRTRIFIKPPGGEVVPSDLRVEFPIRFHGLPGKPLADDHPHVFQTTAYFPGVLPEQGFSVRNFSDLESLIGALGSVKQFCKEFTKSGGTFHLAMADNEDVPNLAVEMSIKDFFSL